MKTWFINKLQLNEKSGKPSPATQIIGCTLMVAIQVSLLNVLIIAYQNALPM